MKGISFGQIISCLLLSKLLPSEPWYPCRNRIDTEKWLYTQLHTIFQRISCSVLYLMLLSFLNLLLLVQDVLLCFSPPSSKSYHRAQTFHVSFPVTFMSGMLQTGKAHLASRGGIFRVVMNSLGWSLCSWFKVPPRFQAWEMFLHGPPGIHMSEPLYLEGKRTSFIL